MVGQLTDFASVTALRKIAFDTYVWGQARDDSFWLGNEGLMGGSKKDHSKPIHFVDSLTKTEKGDRCIMPFVLEIDTDGVAGDNTLEGQEAALVPDYAEIKLDQWRIATKSKGMFSEQQTMVEFKTQAPDKLGYRMGAGIDELMFQAAAGISYTLKLDQSARTSGTFAAFNFASDVTAPSTNRTVFAGSATSTATLTANDKMSYNVLVKAKAKAVSARLKPIKIKGMNAYIVVMDAFHARDLRLDPDYKTAVGMAGNRGEKNPLFTGYFADVGGLILYEHNRVPSNRGGTLWGAGNTVQGAQALLLGAQALAFAQIGKIRKVKSNNTDYGNRDNEGMATMIGVLKPQFKSYYESGQPTEDFSLINIYTAASNS